MTATLSVGLNTTRETLGPHPKTVQGGQNEATQNE